MSPMIFSYRCHVGRLLKVRHSRLSFEVDDVLIADVDKVDDREWAADAAVEHRCEEP